MTFEENTESHALHLPAEWYPQSAIQLTWPHAGTDWAYCLDEITHTFLSFAEVITRYEPLIVVTPEPQVVGCALRQKLGDEAMQRVTILECPTDDTWARDHGGITLVDGSGNTRVLDFRFNGWGEKFPSSHDNAITRSMSSAGIFAHPIESHDDFVFEGGSIESDGKGTVLTTSACLLAPHRNQPLTRQEIEEQLLRRLHASRVLWLDHGSLLGDDTDGHVDTLVRFAPGETLLYVGCDDADDPQYEDILAMERQLRTLRTADGQPYRLLRLPMPRPVYEEGERLPATYANFVVLNGAVVVPTYQQADLDERACEMVAQAFPGLDIIGLDALTVVRQHGSLHCLTMQYPAGSIFTTT